MSLPAGVQFRGGLVLAALLLLAVSRIAAAEEEEAYFGQWKSGQGDFLRIDAHTLQLNTDPSRPYQDITEDSDGSFYLLQITTAKIPNGFKGKFLRISFGSDPDRFTLTTYLTESDALSRRNESSRSDWIAADEEKE